VHKEKNIKNLEEAGSHVASVLSANAGMLDVIAKRPTADGAIHVFCAYGAGSPRDCFARDDGVYWQGVIAKR
jgi:hypothetical protein